MQDPTIEFLSPRLVESKNIDEKHSRITIEPLERGFGHTLGNALRRILLSSSARLRESPMSALRVFCMKYSALEGVQEDVIDILLNLKVWR